MTAARETGAFRSATGRAVPTRASGRKAAPKAAARNVHRNKVEVQ
jgi:hypothetical protein